MAGTYQCFHCGENTVVWDADFNFEDYCLEGEGIVHICHCTNCGAGIQYNVPIVNETEIEPQESEDK